MTPDWLAWPETQSLIKAFSTKENALRFVGGAVRDALLNRAVVDIDAATPLLPEVVMDLLKSAGIRAIPTGIEHGTVTAVIGKKTFEITTLRKDVATYGRHADVAFTDDWREDAARRDFTMNALYLTPEGKLFDYFAGEKDARAGHVRFIGSAASRIEEDYLRILRFFRFYAHYGNGAPDSDALAASAASAEHLTKLSGERLQQECLKLLAAKRAYPVLEIMHKAKILKYALGVRVEDLAVLAALEKHSPEATAIEKLAALLAPMKDAAAACDTLAARLKLSNATAKHLRQLIAEQKNIARDMSEAEQKKRLRRLGAELFMEAVALSAARNSDAPYADMLRLAKEWSPPLFPISGDDLIALGIAPGKAMGEMLARLEEAWEADDYKMSKEALLKL